MADVGTSGIDGLSNFRDTGGMPLTSGGRSRSGVLFRSDAPSALTEKGAADLAATPIGVVVDLRTSQERAAAPDRLPASRPFHEVDLSILEGAMAGMMQDLLDDDGTAAPSPAQISAALAALPALGEMYVGMLQHGADAFAQIARLVTAARDDVPTAVLVHCTAGKDRTGVATALLLDAAGVERGAIVADYASSEGHLAGPWADGTLQMISSLGLPLTPEVRTLVTGTPPAAIEQALTWIDTEFGGAAGYLASGGLTPAGLAALRSRLAG
ncbi:tyrosine-protein phosphatase [Microbacterium sp. KSW4-16]|uniref:tyrosine-protein phosphatase n=1 Tax=Microbacterium aurugineum TaxID=2851642 RepID=UPI0020BEF89E|nr:tyrosine-protein phosphatase [Microbacterium aurugineum]MCK8468767.1 tyrosine-protein phosphatase [Microbacterium aurugineum]